MSGSWSTTSALILAKITEMDMEIDESPSPPPPPPPSPSSSSSSSSSSPSSSPTAPEVKANPRPRLKRENAILAEKPANPATKGEDKFINQGWLEVTDCVTDRFSVREMSEGMWMGSSSRTSTRKAARQQQRPQEQTQRGLVNGWWAERLRADSVMPLHAVRVGATLDAVDTVLEAAASGQIGSNSELSVVGGKSPEIWATSPPEEDVEPVKIHPQRRRPLGMHADSSDAWQEVFLSSLPLTNAAEGIARPPSRKGEEHEDEDTAIKEEPAAKRTLESFYLIQPEDLLPSLPHGVLNPDPLEPIKLDASSIWSSQLSKDLDSIETSYDLNFAPPETTTPPPEPSKTRNLTSNTPVSNPSLVEHPSELAAGLGIEMASAPDALGRHLPEARVPFTTITEYEETDEEIDQLDQDIENFSDNDSWEDTSSDSSDSSDDDTLCEHDEDDNYDNFFSDPSPSFTWYTNLPHDPAPQPPDLADTEALSQVPAVQKWMSELNQLQQQQLPTTASPSLTASAEAAIVAACSVPIGILENDLLYADLEVLPHPRAAQAVLIERALYPERMESLYPRRSGIVVQKATSLRRTEVVLEEAEIVGAPYPAEGLMEGFYRKIEEGHRDVEMEGVGVGF